MVDLGWTDWLMKKAIDLPAVRLAEAEVLRGPPPSANMGGLRRSLLPVDFCCYARLIDCA
jgi:hypothetical protein